MPILIILRKLAAASRQELETRAVIRKLHSFDDRLLADIGIQRHEIEDLMRNKNGCAEVTGKAVAQQMTIPTKIAEPVSNDNLPIAA